MEQQTKILSTSEKSKGIGSQHHLIPSNDNFPIIREPNPTYPKGMGNKEIKQVLFEQLKRRRP